jgi:hypothetical protein
VRDIVKTLAVKAIKPLVGDTLWQGARSLATRSMWSGGAGVSSTIAPPDGEAERRRAAKELTALGRKFRTDKARTHNYTQHYARHLEHLRTREFNLLEIGIGGASKPGQGGASLQMWKHYFPRAQIVGLDIVDKSFLRAPRIHTYQGSQVNEKLLRQICADFGSFDVIIDDGSHRPAHIRKTFRILFPLLNEGGVYAIEDTQTSYWPEWGGNEDLQSRTTTMALVKDLIDGLNYEEFVDESYQPSYTDQHVVAVHAYHNLVIIEKGQNAEGTLRRRILRKRYSAQNTDPGPS